MNKKKSGLKTNIRKFLTKGKHSQTRHNVESDIIQPTILESMLTTGPPKRRRCSIYVSDETHAKLMNVLKRVADDRISISAYVENIILLHFEQHRDEINARNRELHRDNIV